nr:NmrA family NAD(P)-binding protein [Rhizobium sp. BK379]
MRQLKILVIGGTGSVGRLVVSEALAKGHKVRALVRNAACAVCQPSRSRSAT